MAQGATCNPPGLLRRMHLPSWVGGGHGPLNERVHSRRLPAKAGHGDTQTDSHLDLGAQWC